ncbi:unnamed protein product [Urochloa humidicola]
MSGGANGKAGGLRALPKRGLQRVTGICCGLGGGGGKEPSADSGMEAIASEGSAMPRFVACSCSSVLLPRPPPPLPPSAVAPNLRPVAA